MRFFGARRLFLLASSALLGVTALGLTALGLAAPASAQFFFPFFDNRPTTPPAATRRPSAEPSLRRRPSDQPRKPKSGPHHPKTSADPRKSEPGKAAPAPVVASPVVEGPPPPYEPQLLRLSEIMGALAYLQTICAGAPAQPAGGDAVGKDGEGVVWRDRMQNLIAAEAAGPTRRDRLAGAYNQGFQGYEVNYRSCTPHALLVQKRFLAEGGRLAHEISTQYRAN